MGKKKDLLEAMMATEQNHYQDLSGDNSDDLGTLAQLNWFPGHMAKARRIITENLKLVDVVIELRDARIPYSSENPILQELIGTKPHIVALNKIDLADPVLNKKWEKYFSEQGKYVVNINSLDGVGIRNLVNLADELAKAKTHKNVDKGVKPRNARVMIVGIPNVGKSSLINRLAKSASMKTGDKPGVTKAKQWIKIKNNLDLLDTPGILWPKFDDPEVGLNLAFTGAISDEVYDIERAAQILLWRIKDKYGEAIKERYKLKEIPDSKEELFDLIGRKRGFLGKGGIIDPEKTAIAILKDYRSGRLGKITLEDTDDIENRLTDI